MKHAWKRVKIVYLFPKYIRDDKEFIIESSPAGVFNVYEEFSISIKFMIRKIL